MLILRSITMSHAFSMMQQATEGNRKALSLRPSNPIASRTETLHGRVRWFSNTHENHPWIQKRALWTSPIDFDIPDSREHLEELIKVIRENDQQKLDEYLTRNKWILSTLKLDRLSENERVHSGPHPTCIEHILSGSVQDLELSVEQRHLLVKAHVNARSIGSCKTNPLVVAMKLDAVTRGGDTGLIEALVQEDPSLVIKERVYIEEGTSPKPDEFAEEEELPKRLYDYLLSARQRLAEEGNR